MSPCQFHANWSWDICLLCHCNYAWIIYQMQIYAVLWKECEWVSVGFTVLHVSHRWQASQVQTTQPWQPSPVFPFICITFCSVVMFLMMWRLLSNKTNLCCIKQINKQTGKKTKQNYSYWLPSREWANV